MSQHLNRALLQACAEGAGHAVHHIEVGALDFPVLRSAHAWHQEQVPPALMPVQDDIAWASHVVISPPALAG